jgi:hypothetical protein
MPCHGPATRPGLPSGVSRPPWWVGSRVIWSTVVVLGAFFGPGPAAFAQSFGQWSWDGALGVRRITQTATLDGDEIRSRDESNLEFTLNAKGFIVHPAVARFRVGVNAALSKYGSTSGRNNRLWGFDAGINGLPRGAYPFSVYARRQSFAYEQLRDGDPLGLLSVPDTSTAFGGRLRFRRGFLNGTLLGFDRQGISYLDAESRSTRDEQAFVDWSRSSRTFSHHFRLRRRVQEFRLADFGTRDLTLNYDQRGDINPSWRWDMFVIGLHRALDSPAARGSTFDNLRTRQLLVHTMPSQNRVELSYSGGLTRGAVGDTAQSHWLLSRYRWWTRPRWEVTPFIAYSFQVRQGLTVQAPQVGLHSSWSGRAGAFDSLLNGGVGYTRFRRSAGTVAGGDSTLTMEASAVLGHGQDDRLRTELEAAWGRNQLQLIGEAIPELPDLGLSLGGLGTEDSVRGRITLRRRWGSLYVSAYSELSHRGTARTFLGERFTFDQLTNTLQIVGRSFTLTGNLGRSRVDETDRQSIDTWSASASWRPLRPVSLSAWYRSDSRRLAIAPDIDGESLEVRADVWLGAFLLSGRLIETTQRSLEIPGRTNKGFTVSLSRRFGGWLPFRTGPSPNGVIR